MKKLVNSLLIILVLSFCIAGCSSKEDKSSIRLEEAKIGVMTGTTGEIYALESLPDAKVEGFPSIMNAIAALKAGKVDAVITANVTAAFVAKENSDLQAMLEYPMTNEPVCIAVDKSNPELLKEIDDIITQLKADGTMDDMTKRWTETDLSSVKPIDIPIADGEVLKIGVSSTREPFDYLDNGETTGLAPELALRIGEKLGRKIEFVDMEFSALIAALQSGKIDAICTLIVSTPEREKAVNFSQDYYLSGQVLLKQKDTDLILPEDLLAKKSQSGVEEQEQSPLKNSDFIGKKFAIITGTMQDQVIKDNLGNNEIMYFNTMHDAAEAVKNKKVDATVGDEPTMRKFLASNPELIMILPALTQEEYGIVVSKKNPELTEKLNEFYDIIKADGTYDEMIARWIDSKDIADMPDIPLPTDKGTLKIAVDALCEPLVFYNGENEIVGFDIEYARRFAQFMDMDLEVVNMDFGAIIPSVQSGKTDFGSSLITITEERAKSIDFTKPYYIGGTTILTLGTAEAVKGNFIDNFKKSFYQNFILENRYKMLLSGLWITIVISILALFLGTIMGFFICFLSMSKYKVLNWISKIYITILRGTPMVVLLMITYYIIFAKVNINPIIVAVIAFSLSGGAFISQIIRSSILTVDKGQIEAARSMGFSSIGTFFIITLPQAIRVALPLYKSEFINMVKQTAIVGYIAIVDLTKVGDIIRSRTYDAFFPLIAVAVIYLIAIGLFILIFNTIYKLTDKRQRRKPKKAF